MVEMSEVPVFLLPPWIFVLLAANGMTFLAFRVPEIRRGLKWCSAGQRVLREIEKSEKRHQQQLEARKADFADGLSRIVRIGNIENDPEARTLSFSLHPRRTLKRQLRRAVVWLANRPWWVERPITERILRSIIRRLGA